MAFVHVVGGDCVSKGAEHGRAAEAKDRLLSEAVGRIPSVEPAGQRPPIVRTARQAVDEHDRLARPGFDDVDPRASTMPLIGHDARAATPPKRVHRELRLPDDESAAEYELGQRLDVSVFGDVRFVDVSGRSKGKGFAGVMKRYRFKGLCASHGTERKHRSAGSIGGHGTNLGTGPKVRKGKRMAGRMGGATVTVRSLDVVKIDPERNLLLVKGPVPGPNRGLLFIRQSKRLYKPKAKLSQASLSAGEQ